MQTETQTLDISQLSKEQIKAELERREAAEKQQRDKERNEYNEDNENFIVHTVNKARHLNKELQEFKEFTIREANKLYLRMYQLEGKEPREVKTFSRVSDYDQFKVTVDAQERFVFTDEAEVHVNTIQEILKNKFQDRNKGFYKFFEGVMMRNSKNEFDPKLLYKAKAHARHLGEESIINELDKLGDCLRVIGTSLYCRFYMRDDKGKWKDITLQFSAL